MDKLIGLVSSPQQSAAPMVAAQALNRAAQKRGARLAIETRSALGVEHPLSPAEIAGARTVLIAADATDHVDETPFAGKTIHRVSLDDAIREADAVLARAAAGSVAAGVPTSAAPGKLRIVAMAPVQIGWCERKTAYSPSHHRNERTAIHTAGAVVSLRRSFVRLN